MFVVWAVGFLAAIIIFFEQFADICGTCSGCLFFCFLNYEFCVNLNAKLLVWHSLQLTATKPKAKAEFLCCVYLFVYLLFAKTLNFKANIFIVLNICKTIAKTSWAKNLLKLFDFCILSERKRLSFSHKYDIIVRQNCTFMIFLWIKRWNFIWIEFSRVHEWYNFYSVTFFSFGVDHIIPDHT